MDKHYVKKVIEGLKSTSSTRVQESLLEIRSKLISNENGIRLLTECGGLNYLIPHLRKPNERILDLTLSILGNCCLNEECRLAVGNLHIEEPLILVLKTVCRDSIVGRACRVIGNLAQNTSSAEDLHNHGAVPALVTLFENRDKNTSYPTLTMAVRAIRQLWTVAIKRVEMLNLNAVRCIAILLTGECESANMLKPVNPESQSELRKSQEELITGILKCFGYFTSPATIQCAEQIQGDGRGYQCLVVLTKKFESLALRCLINLCYLSPCRPLLGNAGMVQCLLGILQKIIDVSLWPEGAARALYQLSGESVNRARIRINDGLPLILKAANDDMHALRALLQYVFDDMSIKVLVSDGLVSFLTAELQKHLETMDYEHDYKEPISEITKSNSPKIPDRRTDCDEIRVKDDSTVSLFKRRKYNPKCTLHCNDGLNVVIERDNMYVGFSDMNNSDDSDSQNEEESTAENVNENKLKRQRPRSPMAFIKRSRLFGLGVYWEMKPDAPSTSSSTPMSPEPAPTSPCSDGNSGFSPEYRWSSKRHCDWSPESGFSTGEGSAASPYWNQWSPSNSSPTSPFSIANEETSDSELSGRYSPVCSEHETEATAIAKEIDCDVVPQPTTEEIDAAQAALDDLAMADDHLEDDDTLQDRSKEESEDYIIEANSSRIACVLVLLYRLANDSYDKDYFSLKEPTKPNKVLELLTTKECLNALLDYIERCKKPKGRPTHILKLIFGNSLCLINVLKHRVALRLYNMSCYPKHPIKTCHQCRTLSKLSVGFMAQLTTLSEARYGIGEISYQLLRGPDDMKEILSVTLPYIVKAKAALRTYFVVCNALMVLFALLSTSSEDFQYYVTAIGKLATSIRIKDPKSLENRFSDQVSVSLSMYVDDLPKDEIVIFELDDSSTVKANKTLLCKNSEVFSAMLKGCFKESIEGSVRIKNVTREGLKYLLTLLNYGFNNEKCDVESFPMADKLETNLEALLLADRYLLDKLKVLVNSAILQFALSPHTAANIYIWSLTEGMGFLCVESAAYLLTGKMCEKQRARLFNNILNLEYKEQWLDDIKTILMRQLQDWS